MQLLFVEEQAIEAVSDDYRRLLSLLPSFSLCAAGFTPRRDFNAILVFVDTRKCLSKIFQTREVIICFILITLVVISKWKNIYGKAL